MRASRFSTHRPQVIPHIKRTRALRTNRLRLRRRRRSPTTRTLKMFYFRHTRSVAATAFIPIHRAPLLFLNRRARPGVAVPLKKEYCSGHLFTPLFRGAAGHLVRAVLAAAPRSGRFFGVRPDAAKISAHSAPPALKSASSRFADRANHPGLPALAAMMSVLNRLVERSVACHNPTHANSKF
jgi:hypothetical protein